MCFATVWKNRQEQYKQKIYNNKGLAIQVLIIFLFNFYTFHTKDAILWQQKQILKMTYDYNTRHFLTFTLDLKYQTLLSVPYPLHALQRTVI